jgi:hypothetical protein
MQGKKGENELLHEAGVPGAVAQAPIGYDSERCMNSNVSVGRKALEHAAACLPDLVRGSQNLPLHSHDRR